MPAKQSFEDGIPKRSLGTSGVVLISSEFVSIRG
jgi:hypothetical protein